MTPIPQKITPNLWFDREAEEAAKLYTSTIKNSKIGRITRAGKAGYEITKIPEGTVMTIEFVVGGMNFVAINGGPTFKFTPAISFLIACNTKKEVEGIWEKLADGGKALMELGEYPFSAKYGWTQDKYGLSWQVMYMGDRQMGQKITPTLMYVGEQWGKAEAAINYYASIFHSARIGDIMRYAKGMPPDQEGTIQHASFTLEGQEFAAMDSAQEHLFSFNEAISLMIPCDSQKEIDYYWEKLTTGGGQEGMCGWLKDQFGVSWQVTPSILSKMLEDPDPLKVEKVTNAFLKMKKFDLNKLEKAYRG
jgi:predicted 3-demethylubiquinone-9 3-methyltransferase (glyoxalase superfamily)